MEEGKYKIWSDIGKNRLYLILSGHMSDDQIKEASDLTIAEAKKLKPGFSVINDIHDFKPASKEGAENIKNAQAYVVQNGVSHIVRVVGASVITNMQFNRTGREADTSYKADIVGTFEEAEKLLDSE